MFFITYSEVEFIKAKTYARGLYGSTTEAEASYNAGIEANMQTYGISSNDITNYLAQEDIDIDGDGNVDGLDVKWNDNVNQI